MAVPFTGVVYVEVEAGDEEAAIDAAVEKASLVDDDGHISDAMEWEATRQIVQGNVFYGRQNRAEAEEVE